MLRYWTPLRDGGRTLGLATLCLCDDQFQLVRLRPIDFPAHTGYALPTLVDSIGSEHRACDKDLADAAVYVGGVVMAFIAIFDTPDKLLSAEVAVILFCAGQLIRWEITRIE